MYANNFYMLGPTHMQIYGVLKQPMQNSIKTHTHMHYNIHLLIQRERKKSRNK